MELTGAAGPWEKLVLPGVFSQSEALRTVVERPVLFMQSWKSSLVLPGLL